MKRYNNAKKGTVPGQNKAKKTLSLSLILWIIPLAVSGYLLYKSPNLLREVKNNNHIDEKKEKIKSVLNHLQKEKQQSLTMISSTPRVYFCQVMDNQAKLIPFKVDLVSEDNQVEEILQKLFNPPQGLNSRYQSLIPVKTKVNRFTIDSKKLVLDLTEDFVNDNYGQAGKKIKIAQLISTLTSLKEVEEVQILINGEYLPYLDSDGLIKNKVFKQLDIEYRVALD